MSEQPVIHDGQGDAMPCDCPACRRPSRARRAFAIDLTRAHIDEPTATGFVNVPIAACRVWCGDACTCGRGPESADLDPVDRIGMRAIEGRT